MFLAKFIVFLKIKNILVLSKRLMGYTWFQDYKEEFIRGTLSSRNIKKKKVTGWNKLMFKLVTLAVPGCGEFFPFSLVSLLLHFHLHLLVLLQSRSSQKQDVAEPSLGRPSAHPILFHSAMQNPHLNLINKQTAGDYY